MIELQKLSCNSCGAPIEVSATAQFATCNHCSTQLAIRRTKSATFTEQLEHLEAGQDELRDRLDRVELESRLAQLERDWERTREELVGSGNEPPTGLSIVLPGVFGGILGIVAIVIGQPFFGILIGAAGLGTAAWSYRTMKVYDAALGRYRKNRLNLVYDLEASRPADSR